MSQEIKNPAHCKILNVIHFNNPKYMKKVEIHRQLSEAYGENNSCEGINRRSKKMGLNT